MVSDAAFFILLMTVIYSVITVLEMQSMVSWVVFTAVE